MYLNNTDGKHNILFRNFCFYVYILCNKSYIFIFTLALTQKILKTLNKRYTSTSDPSKVL